MIRSDGTPKELEVRQGAWSDWLRVKFKLGMLQSVRGMVRFHFVACEPELVLYASPINFDPDCALLPDQRAVRVRQRPRPRDRPVLHDRYGRRPHGLNNERISEAAFLDQCAIAWREREAMMLHALEWFDEGLFYVLFDTPDRSSTCSGGSASPTTRLTGASLPIPISPR